MARQSIDTSPTGDTLKQGFDKSEANFGELYEGKANAEREVFTRATLINGATAYNTSTYGEVGFYKNAFGRVHLQGMVTTGALTSALFVLPEGARPAFNMIVVAMAGGQFARVDIISNGEVRQVNGNTNWCSLTGITFMAAEA